MKVVPFSQDLIPHVHHLMTLGEPFIWARTHSDYWLYSRLFSSSCPIGLVDDAVVGAVIAFRSQDDPSDIYIQDVMTHPEHRQQGIARSLIDAVRQRAVEWGCERIYLTSEPDNAAACATWRSLGFSNVPGDYVASGVSVAKAFKGPDKDRAVFELELSGSPERES